MPSLLIGAGNSRIKKVFLDQHPDWTGELITLDMDPNCGSSMVWDLDIRPLPFSDGEFDEIGAYDVLEHLGRQGDWRGWFDEMAEYHRILKPGGLMGVIVPVNADALADPGHARFFSQNHFGFLSQEFYANNLKLGAPITDYRFYWKLNFDIAYINENDHHLSVILRKPL